MLPNLNLMQQSACLVIKPVTENFWLTSLIGRRWIGRQTLLWQRLKSVHFKWFGSEFFCLLLVPLHGSIVTVFCFKFPVVWSDTPEATLCLLLPIPRRYFVGIPFVACYLCMFLCPVSTLYLLESTNTQTHINA